MTKATIVLLPLSFFLVFSSCLVMPASTYSPDSTQNSELPANGTLARLNSQSPESNITPTNEASPSSLPNLVAVASELRVGIIGFGLLIHSNKHGNRRHDETDSVEDTENKRFWFLPLVWMNIPIGVGPILTTTLGYTEELGRPTAIQDHSKYRYFPPSM